MLLEFILILFIKSVRVLFSELSDNGDAENDEERNVCLFSYTY